MRIGIDFDNTIICYTDVFHAAAVARGFITVATGRDKTAVRDALRMAGREDDWTELQGIVYGSRIGDAAPFDGIKEFMRARLADGDGVYIVSHKTRTPYRGESVDLHAAALGWLDANGFFRDVGLPRGNVHFELTKEDKLARIGALSCDVFFDDLPEFLAEPGFPGNVRPILFDPDGHRASDGRLERISSWQNATAALGRES